MVAEGSVPTFSQELSEQCAVSVEYVYWARKEVAKEGLFRSSEGILDSRGVYLEVFWGYAPCEFGFYSVCKVRVICGQED